MTRFQVGDRVVVNSPVKQEYKGKIGKVIAVDLIDWKDRKVIEGYVVEFLDRSDQIFVGAARAVLASSYLSPSRLFSLSS